MDLGRDGPRSGRSAPLLLEDERPLLAGFVRRDCLALLVERVESTCDRFQRAVEQRPEWRSTIRTEVPMIRARAWMPTPAASASEAKVERKS